MDTTVELDKPKEPGGQELYMFSLRKMAEHNLSQNRNSLTSLYNIRAFFYACGELMVRHPELKFAVIVLDIAQFKSVNEFCGREAGDGLLKCIAEVLRIYENERPVTCACHVRADNFALFTSYESEEELVDIVHYVEEKIEEFPLDCKVLPAFGICTSEHDHDNVSSMKDCATIAMNTIKGKFYASYAFFDEKMHMEQLREKRIENDIVESMKNGDFALYIQPKVDMKTGKIVGGEALVRWIHPKQGMIKPDEFIPVLEKNGFIINLDIYMWEKVFQFISDLFEEGIQPVPISINVSRVHVYDKNFCNSLCGLVKKYNVPASYVPLELTESAFLGDKRGMYDRMEFLR